MAIHDDLATLSDMYGSPMSENQIDLYIEALSDIDPITLHAGIIELIKTSKWMPKISEIREAVQTIQDKRETVRVMDWHEQNKRISPWIIRGIDAVSPNRKPVQIEWKSCPKCGVSYSRWSDCPDCNQEAI